MTLVSFDSFSLPAEENELSRRYLDIMTRWVRIPMSLYADWPVRPNCGHFFGGVYWYGMETALPGLVLAAAASSPEFDWHKAGYSADELRAAALRGLRYLLFTHDTGPADCVRPAKGLVPYEGACTKWGERGKGFFRESQCAWTISAMVLTAAFIRELLTEEELRMLGAVASDYISRFSRIEPKTGVYNNTQTEEKGWTALGLVASACILPGIEDEEALWDSIKTWMFRTVTTPQDAQNTCEFDGKSVSKWCGHTFTTLPDMTAKTTASCIPAI